VFRLALKNLFSRKLRLVGTALSVTLGIAFLAGTLVFTDTIMRTFDDLFADVYDTTDTVVRSASSVEFDMGAEFRPRIPEATVDLVGGVDGVAEAQPEVTSFAQLVDASGDPIGTSGMGAPTFGMNFTSGELSPWVLTDGSRAPGPGELVIDQGSADEGGFELGDTVTVLTQTGPHQLPLVGTVRFGTVDSPGGASFAMFDLATAQQLFGASGTIDAVVAAAEPGVSEEELTARVAAVLPDDQEAVTGSDITDEVQNQVGEAMGFFNTFLLVFAAVGLVVACFTIFNTFQIVITQRMRELALLRAVGATSRQVLGGQLLEAVMIGIIASVAGLGFGVVVAGLLKAMLAAVGWDIPAGGTVILPRTVVASLVVGTVVTVVAAVLPALRASRIPPIAALRDVALDLSARPSRRLVTGVAVLGAGVVAFVAGLRGSAVAWVGVGALLLFVGVFTLGPLIARPVAGALGVPIETATGITGGLARENAMRNPKRTARTGGALMVGVALVCGITIIAASLKDWISDIFDDTFVGDYVVSTDTFGFGGLSPQLAADLNALPEVGVATGVRMGAARLTEQGDESNITYLAVDPATAEDLFDIGIVAGTLDELADDAVLVDDGKADSLGVGLGDTLTIRFLDGSSRPLQVTGIYTEDDLAGNFVVSHGLHESTGTDQFDASVYVSAAPGVDDSTAMAAITATSDGYANADVLSRSAYLDDQAKQIDPLVNLIYALLGLAIIIALFSIANSMALSIHERTRELGLLRAVGMSRRQTRSAVRWESVLIALLGTGLGVLLGVFFGWSISVAVRDAGLGAFSIPVVSVVVIALLAILGALIAAARPAYRASRLDVLRAIATE
jgi:putative ABC transport system permease protein